jgi:hypothetical protein
VRGQWLVVVLSLGAAFAFAASNLLKHISAGRVPDAQSLQPTQVGDFIRATLSQPLWLGGIACDIIAVGLQVLALHLGSLSVVQPLLITGLLFALILRPESNTTASAAANSAGPSYSPRHWQDSYCSPPAASPPRRGRPPTGCPPSSPASWGRCWPQGASRSVGVHAPRAARRRCLA